MVSKISKKSGFDRKAVKSARATMRKLQMKKFI